jgi:ABC-2 type transport system ATP-binding protein
MTASVMVASQPTVTGPAIEVRDLRRTFRSHHQEVEAVAGVDLLVEHGQVFGFLGPNGAGKTTTLRMLATLLKPTSGSAMVAGCDLLREPERVRQRIGYVGQRGGADFVVTGRRELVFQARLYGLSRADATQRAASLLALLDLEVCADRPYSSYSGGQRRRLDLALGLVHQPQVLFLDEPTTGLDPQGRARVWDEVRRLRTSGVTVFLTTHYLEEADALCDRLAIIDHGRIVAEGTPDELKREIAGDVVTLSVTGSQDRALELLRGLDFVREVSADEAGTIRLYVDRGDRSMPAILRLFEGSSSELQTISMTRPSLDDVFLHKTGRKLREEGLA